MGNSHWLTRTLPRMRIMAEQLMKDWVRIYRPTGQVAVNTVTGVAEPIYDLVYAGVCKLQTTGGIAQQSSASATGESSNIGGVVPVWSLYLYLPVNVITPAVGDIAEITQSVDPANQGRRFRLVNLQSEKTFATAKRWNVSEIPKEVSP